MSSRIEAYRNACSIPMQRMSTAQPVRWFEVGTPPYRLVHLLTSEPTVDDNRILAHFISHFFISISLTEVRSASRRVTLALARKRLCRLLISPFSFLIWLYRNLNCSNHWQSLFKFSTCASFGTFSIPVFVLQSSRSVKCSESFMFVFISVIIITHYSFFDQGPLGIPKGDACLSKKATKVESSFLIFQTVHWCTGAQRLPIT